MNQLGSQEHQAHYLVIVIISKQLVQIHTWVMRTGINGSSCCYAKSLHCRLMIVIIGTHNTDILSTKAVNDLVMILYYDACYADRSSSSKGFHHRCSYRSGGSCSSHTELTRLLGMCPFLSTLLLLILDPNHQEHFHWYMPWTGCDTTYSFHGKMKKSCPTCNQWFVTLTVYIYNTDFLAAMWRFIWHDWTCSQTTVNVLRRCMFSWT